MGHNVGEAAARSTAKSQAKNAAKVWTLEEATKEIRGLREGKLFVNNMELVDVLLAGHLELLDVYGKLSVTSESLQQDCEKYLKRNNELMDALLAIKFSNCQLSRALADANARLQKQGVKPSSPEDFKVPDIKIKETATGVEFEEAIVDAPDEFELADDQQKAEQQPVIQL